MCGVAILGGCSDADDDVRLTGEILVERTVEFGMDFTFGSIDDVVPTADGVVVVDKMMKAVRRFDWAGNALPGLDRVGEGPGELSFPEGVGLRSPSEVVLLDPGNGGLQFFALDDSLRFSHRLALPNVAYGLCTLGEEVFVARHNTQAVVSRIDGAGAISDSIGLLEPPENRFLEPFALVGTVLCDETHRRVIFVPEAMGDPIAWDLESQEVSRVTVPGFVPRELVASELGITTAPSTAEGFHILVGASLTSDDRLALQYIRYSDFESSEESQVAIEREDGGFDWWSIPSGAHLRAEVEGGWIVSGLEPVPWVALAKLTWVER